MRTRQATFMNDYKAPDQKHNIKLKKKKKKKSLFSLDTYNDTCLGTYFGFQQGSLHPDIISDE